MDLDHIIERIGGCGRYQLWVYHWYCMLTLSVAFHHLAQVFLAGESDYWCTLPSNTTQFNCTEYENDGECDELYWSRPKDNNLTIVNEAQCSFLVRTSYVNSSNVIECDGNYTFDHSHFTYTIQEDFNLVCSDKVKISLAQTVYFAGVFTGSLIFGTISDRFGRKPTLIVCVVLQCSFGFLTAFVRTFAAFCVLRYIVAAAAIGVYIVSFTMVTEMVSVKWRTKSGLIIFVYYVIGLLLLTTFAYFIRDWRKLQITLSVSGISMLFVLPFLPESIRWLLSQGAIEKAEIIIKSAAKMNKISISEHPFSEGISKNDTGNVRYTIVDLFRTPILRKRTMCVMYHWFGIMMTYFGLSISTSTLGINPYLSFMLSSLIEAPAAIISIFIIDRFGRRKSLCFVMVFGGISCFLSIFFDPGEILVSIRIAGKFGLTAAFGIAFIYAVEVFPTPVRSAGVGLASMCGIVGSMAAPFVVYVADIWKPFPLIVFSVFSVTGGLSCLLLPETMGISLAETLQERNYSKIEVLTVTQDSKHTDHKEHEAEIADGVV